jgi:hypothetical protein
LNPCPFLCQPVNLAITPGPGEVSKKLPGNFSLSPEILSEGKVSQEMFFMESLR